MLDGRAVVLAPAHFLEHQVDLDPDEEVDQPDQNEKASGDRRADERPDRFEVREPMPGPPGDQGHRQGHQEHDRGMPQREVEPHPQRILPLLDQLAHRVVDGRDVIRIEGVAEPEDVCENPEPQERGLRPRRREHRDSPEEVQPQDRGAIPDPPAVASVHCGFLRHPPPTDPAVGRQEDARTADEIPRERCAVLAPPKEIRCRWRGPADASFSASTT